MSNPLFPELQRRLLNWKLDDILHPVARPGKRGAYKRVFSPLLTLWYLLFQRLNADSKLEAVVLDAMQGGADLLAEGERVPSQKLISSETSSYSDARQRLPECVIREVYERSARRLRSSEAVGSLPKVQLLDGTLIAALSTPAIAREYPPAKNQHGVSDWSQMRWVAAFDWSTGSIDAAAHAPTSTSEQAMVWEVFSLSVPGTLTIADSNFGIFSVSQAARHRQLDVLVRLTLVRAKRLGGSNHWTHGQERVVSWAPTKHDKLHPEADPSPVNGRLVFLRLEPKGFPPIELWLFTTLMDAKEFTPQKLLELYGLRWRAETDFKYLKAQLNLKELTARSPAMMRKEFYAGLIAYNLVREGMQCVAKLLNVPLMRVSFQSTRRALSHGFLELMAKGPGKCRRLKGLLLPIRTQVRPSEPRAVRHRNRTYPPLRGSRSEARCRVANGLAETPAAAPAPILPSNPTPNPKSL